MKIDILPAVSTIKFVIASVRLKWSKVLVDIFAWPRQESNVRYKFYFKLVL